MICKHFQWMVVPLCGFLDIPLRSPLVTTFSLFSKTQSELHLRLCVFLSQAKCLISLICLLSSFLNFSGRQSVTLYSSFALIYLVSFYHKIEGGFRVQTQTRRLKISNQKQVRRAQRSPAHQSHRQRLPDHQAKDRSNEWKMLCTHNKKQKITPWISH